MVHESINLMLYYWQQWTEAPSTPGALVSMLLRLPNLKFVIVTLGENGCIMLEKSEKGEYSLFAVCVLRYVLTLEVEGDAKMLLTLSIYIFLSRIINLLINLLSFLCSRQSWWGGNGCGELVRVTKEENRSKFYRSNMHCIKGIFSCLRADVCFSYSFWLIWG